MTEGIPCFNLARHELDGFGEVLFSDLGELRVEFKNLASEIEELGFLFFVLYQVNWLFVKKGNGRLNSSLNLLLAVFAEVGFVQLAELGYNKPNLLLHGHLFEVFSSLCVLSDGVGL
jgi:hypothetical protein